VAAAADWNDDAGQRGLLQQDSKVAYSKMYKINCKHSWAQLTSNLAELNR